MRISLLVALTFATLSLAACDHEAPAPPPSPAPRATTPAVLPPTTAPASAVPVAAATVAAATNVKCPVSGEDVDPKDPKLATFVYEGKSYVVCCKDCIKDLTANPAKYVKAE